MSAFPNNQSGGSSRRTFSSPYLGNALNRNKTQNRPRARAPGTGVGSNQSGSDRSGGSDVAPPRGSRSAPPHFNTVDPEVHDYYERRSDVEKEIKRKLMKTRLDRLINYQEMIGKEIDSLERDFEMAMHAPPMWDDGTSESGGPKPKLKQFRVVGGCPGNLAYKINRKPGKDGKIRSFSLEVDVKGYIPDKIEVDTEDSTMIIKASKMNGSKKDLKIVAPTVKDMEKAYVHPPRSLLVIDF